MSTQQANTRGHLSVPVLGPRVGSTKEYKVGSTLREEDTAGGPYPRWHDARGAMERCPSADNITHCHPHWGSDLTEGHGWQGTQHGPGRGVGKDMACSRGGRLSEGPWAGLEV